MTDYRTSNYIARTAAEAESRPKGGCCNRRLLELGNEALKTCFHNSSLHKHNNLRKQTTTDQKQVSRGATSRRVPLDAQKKEQNSKPALFEVRIKGLEPPRLSASDPKSDVATNYTISAFGVTKV